MWQAGQSTPYELLVGENPGMRHQRLFTDVFCVRSKALYFNTSSKVKLLNHGSVLQCIKMQW